MFCLRNHKNTEGEHQPSCLYTLLQVSSPCTCGQEFSTEVDGRSSSNHRLGATPQISFVGCYLICSQISADQKACAGDGIELELLHRVIIDYASNSAAAHWPWIQLEVIIRFKLMHPNWEGWNLRRTLGIVVWSGNIPKERGVTEFCWGKYHALQNCCGRKSHQSPLLQMSESKKSQDDGRWPSPVESQMPIIIITIISIITTNLLGTFSVPDIELSILQIASDSILLTKGSQNAAQRPSTVCPCFCK